MDWSSLLSAALGATAALVGVVLTQRVERQKAFDDRIWHDRVKCYMSILRWTHDVRSHAFYRLLATQVGEPLPEPPAVYAGDDEAALFASERVLKPLKETQDAVLALLSQHLLMTKAPASWETDAPEMLAQAPALALAYADLASKRGVELAEAIRRDVYPGRPRTRRPVRGIWHRLRRSPQQAASDDARETTRSEGSDPPKSTGPDDVPVN